MIQNRHPLMPEAEWVSFASPEFIERELIAIVPGIQYQRPDGLAGSLFEKLDTDQDKIGRVVVYSSGVPMPTIIDIREKPRHPVTGQDISTHVLVRTTTQLSEKSGGRMHRLSHVLFY